MLLFILICSVPPARTHLFSRSIHFGRIFHTLQSDSDEQQIQGHFSNFISFQINDIKFWKGKIVAGAKSGEYGGCGRTVTFSDSKKSVIIRAKVGHTKLCFGAATFVVVLQFSQNNVFIELACDRSAFWHQDLNSWTIICEKIAYKTFFTVRICLAILGHLAFLVAHIRLATFRFGSK